MKMNTIINQTLNEVIDLDPNMPLLIGVSGGPDSLVLLHVLLQLKYQIIAAHFNHKLRSNSDFDADFVEKICSKFGIKYLYGEKDIRSITMDKRLSIEEAARIFRYQFLFDKAQKEKAQAVIVGHTADDQVETVLMHLLRGSGLDGLRGIRIFNQNHEWNNSIPLIRPMLSIWREEILAYCQEQGLEPLYDESNQDLIFFRNRIRNEMIPNMETYNPQIKKLIWQTANLADADLSILQKEVEEAWRGCVEAEDVEWLKIDPVKLLNYPLGIQRRIFRKALQQLRPGIRNINFNAVDRAINFVHQPTNSKQIDFLGGLRCVLDREKLWILGRHIQIPTEDQLQWTGGDITLKIPGVQHLNNGWELKIDNINMDKNVFKKAIGNLDPYTAWLNADNITLPIKMGNINLGDRMEPLGLNGNSIKISDLFINEKLPKSLRSGWPIVRDEADIVWIPGFRLGHRYRLTESVKKVILMSVRK